jgi:hypothetical protein
MNWADKVAIGMIVIASVILISVVRIGLMIGGYK